jgi:hypothetical protein
MLLCLHKHKQEDVEDAEDAQPRSAVRNGSYGRVAMDQMVSLMRNRFQNLQKAESADASLDVSPAKPGSPRSSLAYSKHLVYSNLENH